MRVLPFLLPAVWLWASGAFRHQACLPTPLLPPGVGDGLSWKKAPFFRSMRASWAGSAKPSGSVNFTPPPKCSCGYRKVGGRGMTPLTGVRVQSRPHKAGFPVPPVLGTATERWLVV